MKKKINNCVTALLFTTFFFSLQAQITTDSLKQLYMKAAQAKDASQVTEAFMQVQSIAYSDSMLAFNQKLVANVKQAYTDTHHIYATVLASLAIFYMWRGEYEKSLPLLLTSKDIFIKNHKEKEFAYSIVLNNLGLLYERIGDEVQALTFSRQALALRKNMNPNDKLYVVYPLSLDQVATLLMKKRAYDSALLLFKASLEVRKHLYQPGHPYYMLGLSNLGLLYSETGDYDKALLYLTQSLHIYDSAFGKDDIEYILALENLALLYKKMNRLEKALPMFEEVMQWRKKHWGSYNHPRYASSLNNAGTLSRTPNEAAALFCNAAQISIANLRNTYYSLSEHEKLVYLKQEGEQFYYLPSIIYTHQLKQTAWLNQLYENELALKGMVLEDQQQVLRSIRQSGDSNSMRIYRQWRFTKGLCANPFFLAKAKNISYIDSLTEIGNRLEQQLSASSVGFRKLQDIQSVTKKSIAGKLLKGQASIEFIRFRKYDKKWTDSIMYAALILLANDTTVRFVPLFEEKKLKQILVAASKKKAPVSALYPVNVQLDKPLKPSPLYQLIWRPLEKYLNGVHTIYYAPAGLLHRIAFGALQKDAKHLLIDRYQLNQLISTRSLAFTNASPNNLTSATLWGGIDYDSKRRSNSVVIASPPAIKRGSDNAPSILNLYSSDIRGGQRGKPWAALLSTRQEINNIRKIFTGRGVNVKVVGGTVATEEGFKALDGKSPQVLHLATHGFFLPVVDINSKDKIDLKSYNNAFTVQQNPMFRSGLVLAGGNDAWMGADLLHNKEDGILTAYEISQMDLTKTELVVLSACETALGDLQGNEGVIGLQRAFKIAGVRQLILSLWTVGDKQAMELMTLFYKKWLSGQNTREALRSAQLRMRKKTSPYYWAGFVLVE